VIKRFGVSPGSIKETTRAPDSDIEDAEMLRLDESRQLLLGSRIRRTVKGDINVCVLEQAEGVEAVSGLQVNDGGKRRAVVMFLMVQNLPSAKQC